MRKLKKYDLIMLNVSYYKGFAVVVKLIERDSYFDIGSSEVCAQVRSVGNFKTGPGLSDHLFWVYSDDVENIISRCKR